MNWDPIIDIRLLKSGLSSELLLAKLGSGRTKPKEKSYRRMLNT